MPLAVPSVTDIDQATVDAQSAVVTRLVQEYNPTIDAKRGVLHDLLLHLSAVMAAANQVNNQRLLASLSLKKIGEDPTLADTALVDNVLSNWGVVRRVGAAAVGQVMIALADKLTVVVPVGTTFVISGRTFATAAAFAARTSPADVVTPNDRLLTQSGPTWVFPVNVQDRSAGAAGNVAAGTTAVMAQPPPRFASAYAAADFVGGVDVETNAQLLARLPSGLAAKVWGGRGNIDAMIRYQFPDVLGVSVIGFGDPEMRRDRHALWPGSTGGRTDVYVRSRPTYLLSAGVRTATLVAKSGAVGTWQFTLTRDNAPGFYEVSRILAATMDNSAAGFQPSSDVRGYDTSDDGLGLVPDIVNWVEAVYSYFQTAQIQFVDNVTDAGALTLGATAPYRVVVRRLPDVKDIQNFLRDRGLGSSLSDVLVKAVVPCFVSVTATLTVPRGTPAPDVATLQQAVADSVNSFGFVGSLTSSAVVQPLLAAVPGATVTGVVLTGRLRRPDGASVSLVGTDAITLPSQPDYMVTNRTTAFLALAADVAVTVVTASAPQV